MTFSMRPVRNGEAVVDVMIAERRHRLGELGIVLFLTGVKAGVFEHANVAWQHRRNGALCFRPLTILDEAHRPAREPVNGKYQLRRRHGGPVTSLSAWSLDARGA